MKKTIDLSIIIVNYKTPKLTKDCVDSVKKSKPRVSHEVIVIENSIDNIGFAKANNEGIKKARGKYILLLNSDTVVRKGAIDKLYEFAKDHQDAGVVAPKLLNIDGSVQPSVFRFPTIAKAIEQYFLPAGRQVLDKYYPLEQEPSIVDVAVMAAFLITPRALDKVGLLDEKYFMYFEDFDYSRRVNEARLKIYYVPEAEVIHIHGASGGSNKYLVESAKKYHGIVGYYIYTFVLWLGQKWEKIFK